MAQGLHIYYQNTQGLRTKTQTFYENLLSCNYDVICLTETWLNGNIFSGELFGDGYMVYRRDRESSSSIKSDGGGVLIAVKTSIRSTRCTEFETDAEDVWISIDTNGEGRFLLCCAYVPPGSEGSLCEFKDGLCRNEKIFQEGAVLLVGDFNLSSVSWQSVEGEYFLEPTLSGNRFSEIVDTFAYLGLMQFNTTCNDAGRILDLILCNEVDYIKNLTRPTEFLVNENRHHNALEFILNLTPAKILIHAKNYHHNFKRGDFDAVNHHLSQIDWRTELSGQNVDRVVDKFYSIINDIIKLYIPTRRVGGSFPIYFSHKLIKIIKEKNKFHKKYKKYKDLNAYNRFCELRCMSKKIIRQDYKTYIKNIENEISHNTKQLWKYLANKRKSVANIPQSVSWSNKRAKGREVPELFAKYFRDVYVPPVEGALPDTECPKISYVEKINSRTIENVINELDISKSSGPDGIPPLFIKKCMSNLIKPLQLIYNLSLETASFPTRWKTAEISPIFKSGQRDNVENYRPISKLCIFGKLLEKIIYNRVLPSVKNIIIEEQHGFFPGRSLETNLLSFSEHVIEQIDAQGQLDTIYTDFSKAFDKISHEKLLRRLADVGLPESLVEWCKSYLTGRAGFVAIGGHRSETFYITSGVPQGSHLGPLFFLIYINNIKGCFRHCGILLYADDLKIYRVVRSMGDCHGVQEDLDRLVQYCELNDIVLNPSKCFHISFTKRVQKIIYEYKIGNEKLKYVSEIVDLGVTLDEKWSFRSHIEKMISASNKMVGFINRSCKEFRDPRVFTGLYYAFVHSKLSFASVIWNPIYEVHIKRIQRIQNKFLKFLAFKTHTIIENRDYTPIRKKYHMLALKDGRSVQELCILHKIIHSGIDSPFLLNKINLHVPGRDLRDRTLFNVIFRRTNTGQHSPMRRLQATYNSLELNSGIDIVSDGLTRFKKLLKHFFMSG